MIGSVSSVSLDPQVQVRMTALSYASMMQPKNANELIGYADQIESYLKDGIQNTGTGSVRAIS